MTLYEAINHLDECMSNTETILYPEVLEAHKLGIESLKAVESARANNYWTPIPTLPGETS